MFREAYAVVMDDEQNAFALLPKITRFQIMTVLSLMWSAVFTAYVGSYLIFGPTVIAHVVVLLAIFFTADVFRRAEKAPASASAPSLTRRSRAVAWRGS